jgi:hypothetical protein
MLSCSRRHRALCLLIITLAITADNAHADIDWESVPLTKHATLQGVNTAGNSTFSSAAFPIRLQGIVLNDPEDMLDSTANYIPFSGPQDFFNFGGQWQVFIQSVDPNDIGGTALWMAQNVGNVPWHQDSDYSYSNDDWNAEISRLSLNGTLQAGDLIEVRARTGLPFGGKFNVNENHSNEPEFDFEIVLLQKDYGLPTPQEISISDVRNEFDQDLFDFTRQTGGERYQSQLVQLDHLQLVSGSWAPDELVTVTDESGRTLSLKLGLDSAFGSMSTPTGVFSATGIFNQESTGYQLWVTEANDILLQALLGDLNEDGFVGQDDLNIVLGDWGQTVEVGSIGDLNLDGFIGQDDLNVILGAWGTGTPLPNLQAIPEVSSMALVSIAAVFGMYLRKRRMR